MKAVTIKNPYAYLIAKGVKDVENRTWKTNFRGKIYIHVAKKWACKRSEEDLMRVLGFDPEAVLDTFDIAYLTRYPNVPTGCIIGEVEIVDCVQDSSSVWALDNHYHWILDNAVMYKQPILNVKGALSFWEYEK